MIYIDPETGKYTTEDPARKAGTGAMTTTDSGSINGRSNVPFVIAGGMLFLVLMGYAIRSKNGKLRV